MSNYIGNRGGIIFIEATLQTAGSSSANAIYSIPNNTFRWSGPVGLVVIEFKTASGTVSGITLQSNNQTQVLTDYSGAAITDLSAGVYSAVYNKYTNTFKLLS